MRILVIEDEAKMAGFIKRGLEEEGSAVDVSPDGQDGLYRAMTGSYDLIVLDITLPLMDGLDVCRRLRDEQVSTPILLLTARDTVEMKVQGLDSGADDYLTKPFGVRELVARARALLRRPRASQLVEDQTPTPDVVTAGLVRLDRPRRQAHLDSRAIELTPHEFDVLYLLAAHPGIVFTREMLLERVWKNDTHVTERSVDTLIKRLRQKIEVDTGDPQLILTVWGTGYKFNDA
ncbi:MAG TPA: response regulator transcription factor [Blastocatellia bacterium]|nr:response regulator transcription factor [Blastocatellia bacterium]